MANQTTNDNNLDATQRTVPQEMTEISIALSTNVVSASSKFADVKTAVIVCDEPVYFNVSYHDGSTDSPGDLVTANTDTRVLYHPGNDGAFNVLQNTEFNTVHAQIVAGTGTATVRIYPGGGITQ
jgi:hypothetical protein